MINILIASFVDFLIGDPYDFPHPVKLMGKIIFCEERFIRRITNSKKGLKISGLIMGITNILLVFFIPYCLLKFIEEYKIIYTLVNIYLIYTCIAAGSLHYEAMKVYTALDIGIKQGRQRLSHIVGRDTRELTEEEIIKATVETVAENTSDGVIAPLIYMIFLGAPGGLAYKMVNTMDSMVGYMNDEYMDLGYFPAKIDDIFNYIPARITGVLMCISSLFRFHIRNGFQIMVRDRKNHKSPNAAYPEGAVAGLLQIQLGGDNVYRGKLVKKPTIGDNLKDISRNHIIDTIEIMYRSEIVFLLIYILIQYAK